MFFFPVHSGLEFLTLAFSMCFCFDPSLYSLAFFYLCFFLLVRFLFLFLYDSMVHDGRDGWTDIFVWYVFFFL